MRTRRKSIKAIAMLWLGGLAGLLCGCGPVSAVENLPWRDAAYRVTLRNDALEASFQAGFLYHLTDRVTGETLLSVDPDALSSTPIIFDAAPSDLDTCQVMQDNAANAVMTQYTTPDGGMWETRWSIEPGKGDLVLQMSGEPVKPVEQFRAVFTGCDITKRSVVWANVYGVGRMMRAPWTGNFLGDPEKDGSPGGHPQPLVALFQGNDSGWVVEGRDPRIAPANILIQGKGTTVSLGMIRRFPVATDTPKLYEVRMRTYSKHWEDGVDPYIDWLEKEAGFVPFEKKSPAWVKNVETQSYVDIGNFAGLDALAKKVTPAKTFIGRVAGFGNYSFDAGYPDYRVNDEAKKWFAHARNLGFHVGAHFNSRSVSAMWPDLVEKFKPGFQVTGTDAEGKETYASIYEGPNKLYRVSAAYKPWRDYLVAQMKDAVDAGVDIIYLDEAMGTEGKYVVDGVDGLQGTMMLIKQIMDTYPGVAVETEQFNPMTAKYAAFALSQMPLGHPLAGYLLHRFVKVVPEGLMYSPADEPIADAFDSWGFMLPGGNSDFRESGAEITQVFQKFDLTPDSRLPHYTFTQFADHYSQGVTPIGPKTVPEEGLKLFGYRGAGDVTAYFEKHPTWRGLVVYEPGKEPQKFGVRYTNLTTYDGPGLPVYYYFRHTVKDWLIYDGNKLMGLDPKETWWFDKALKPSPTRFHVMEIPDDFVGVIDQDKRVPPQEIGAEDTFFQLTFRANGTMNMFVPNNYDVYLNGSKVQVDRRDKNATVEVSTAKGRKDGKRGPGYVVGDTTMGAASDTSNSSVLLAVKRSEQELNGPWRQLKWMGTLDVGTTVEPSGGDTNDFNSVVGGIGRISGRFPEAKSIRLQGSYMMRNEGPGPPGDGVIRINGKEVARIPHGPRPYITHNFDVDITDFAGQYALLEFISDGSPGRNSAAQWLNPRVVVEP